MVAQQFANRRGVSIGSALLTLAFAAWGVHWLLSPSTEQLVAEGRELFLHEWTPDDPLSGGGDGLGPVFNAKSCVACHFLGGVGGAGTAKHDVKSFQVLPNRRHNQLLGGVIHASATEPTFEETFDTVRSLHPIVPGGSRVIGGCTVRIADFDPLLVETINTPALFGAGLIDEISASAIKFNRSSRTLKQVANELSGSFDITPVGRIRPHGMGDVGRFGWRGQFATLEDFVATACAVELGLTNSVRAQDLPRQHVPDHDAEYDMTSRQLKALVEFCRSLPRPEQVLPQDSAERKRVHLGKIGFLKIGCADCHTVDIGGVKDVYSDFLMYSLENTDGSGGYVEEPEVPFPDDLLPMEEWQTPPLWGVADSAPYFHDGGAATLEQAIARHHGSARHVLERYNALSKDRRENIIAFLSSLRAPSLP